MYRELFAAAKRTGEVHGMGQLPKFVSSRNDGVGAWGENSRGRCQGSQDAAGDLFKQESKRCATHYKEDITKIHALSCRITGWASITHNQILHPVVARTLRQFRISINIEDTTQARQIVKARATRSPSTCP